MMTKLALLLLRLALRCLEERPRRHLAGYLCLWACAWRIDPGRVGAAVLPPDEPVT